MAFDYVMKSTPPRFAIPNPCNARWESMSGNHKRRFCSDCQLHVHNLDEMTEREKTDFLMSSNERKCGVFRGNVPRVHKVSCFRAILTALIAIIPFLLSACTTTGKIQTYHSPEVSDHKQVKEESGKMVMGDIVVERPFWKRIFWPFD